MMPGYNTGKVVIGCHYVPPTKNPMNGNNIFWQRVLLQRKPTLLQRLRAFFEGEHNGN